MFLCLDCGALFEEPGMCIETHGLDCPPYETWNGCPNCSGAYVETSQCSQCGEWITGDYAELDDGTLICEECYQVKNIEELR